MINTGRFQSCVCQRRGTPHPLCDGPLEFQENGVKVTLSLRHGEEAKAIVIDGCVCSDRTRKCDGLYLFKSNNKRWIVLVELKGSHLDDAFEQLIFMRNRAEYAELVELFRDGQSNNTICHVACIISNRQFKKNEIQKLENSFRFRVKVLHSRASSERPDLRTCLK